MQTSQPKDIFSSKPILQMLRKIPFHLAQTEQQQQQQNNELVYICQNIVWNLFSAKVPFKSRILAARSHFA